MPYYSYQCRNCGNISEHFHSIHIKLRNIFCLHCNQWAGVKRLIGPTTFILKGSGWSQTGYQREKNEN